MRVFRCKACGRKLRLFHVHCDACGAPAGVHNWALPVAVVLLVLYVIFSVIF